MPFSGLVVWLGAVAAAQDVLHDRQTVPAAGIATEDGPGALWVNPALVAYDPDPRYTIMVRHALDDETTGIGATAGMGGFGLGVYNRRDAEGISEWSIGLGGGLQLPSRIAVGTHVSWHLQPAGRNWVGWDAGAAWRPVPWIGVGAIAANIGSPDPNEVVGARTGAGVALRPAGSALLIGADYLWNFSGGRATGVGRGTMRFRPAEGVYVRASADTTGRIGGGFEVYFGGHGGGAFVTAGSGDGLDLTGFIGSDEPGESLVRSHRVVPAVVVRGQPPNQTNSTLLFPDRRTPWVQTLGLLQEVEGDSVVRGVVVTLDGAELSLAQHQELRDRIAALEAGGKPVLVYLNGNPGTEDYFTASAASRIVLHPAGQLLLTGLSSEVTTSRAFFDWIGIDHEAVQVGEYKSAVEQRNNYEPSDASLEQENALLDDRFAAIVAGIAAGRKRSPDEVRAWIDDGPFSADEAHERGLVDRLAYPDQADALLTELHGARVKVKSIEDRPLSHSPWVSPAQIAVVYVEGLIVQGESDQPLLAGQLTGSRTVVKQLDRARRNPGVRGVVLRVNSGGGSAFASDEIARAVSRVRHSGKPIVASLGGVAASGGYYVAAGADRIFAEPTTVTGSIGVFSMRLVLSDLFGRAGIHTTVLTRGRHAAMWSGVRKWDDLDREEAQSLADATYARFLSSVSAGRKLDVAAVDAIGRGRVWSGSAAAENGLVDQLGGFDDAIAEVRERANLPSRRGVAIVTLTERGTLLQQVVPALPRGTSKARAETRLLESLPAPALRALRPLAWSALFEQDAVWMIAPETFFAEDP